MNIPYYHIALTFIPGIGALNAKNLIAYCGGAEAVFKESKSALRKIPGLGNKNIADIKGKEAFNQTDKEIQFIEKNGLQVLRYMGDNYPRRLVHCEDAPIVLYQKGETKLNVEKVISIVGTRKATNYGKGFIDNFLQELSALPVQIISGLALGIDGKAHKSALDNQLNTVAILGHHLGMVYPPQHHKLAKEIVGKEGSLISECNSQESMVPGNFPRRNRVIAGMSDAVIVIESDTKGGSIITAQLGSSYNRDVFALPGRYKDKFSRGCNYLIKTHQAQAIESATDLIHQLGWEVNPKKKRFIQSKLLLDLTGEEQKVVDLLKADEALSGDNIAAKSQLKTSELAGTLLSLELKGIIASLPGNTFSLL